MDIDMELLRLVGSLRTEIAGLADAEGLRRAQEAVDRLRERAGKSARAAIEAVAALQAALPDSVPSSDRASELAEVIEAVLDPLESFLFDASDVNAASELSEAVAALPVSRAVDAPPDPVPTAPVQPTKATPAPPAKAEASLHAVAGMLVQIEPTLLESLETLRGHFAKAVDHWSGSEGVSGTLAEALAELDAVLANKRSRKSRREEVVTKVGEAIEVAMREEEDGEVWDPIDAPVFHGDFEDHDELDLDADEAAAVRAEPEPVAAARNAPLVKAPERHVAEASEPDPDPVEVLTSSEAAKPLIVPEDADPDLVNDFVAEGLDYLVQAEEALMALESDPSDTESVNVTFRAFHTIKGVSAFLDLTNVASIAHEAETLLATVREGSIPFTGACADVLLRSADVLRGLLEGIRVVMGGGKAMEPSGMASLMEVLSDPDLAEKVANDESVTMPKTSNDSGPIGPQLARGGTGRDAGSSQDDSVRIRTERLDMLVDLVGELVVSYSMISQDPDVLNTKGDLGKKVALSNKILRELQDLSTSLRMVPLKPAFHKISRVVRDVSKKSGKNVVLDAVGDDTELDRGMVGVITDALVHMVRNSIDHGIESPEARKAAGKPEHGTVRLAAWQAGGNVIVEIKDDGKGLDREAIRTKAVERGLIDPERKLSDAEVYDLIFHPGFSTAKQVTDISGRGVGMDVVKRVVDSLRGRIEIHSEEGAGTRFQIYLPLTLAITDGMLVRIGKELCIIPTVKINVTVRPKEEDLWSVSGKGEMIMLQGELIPVAHLSKVLGFKGGAEKATDALLVVVGEGSRRTALMVDELLGQAQFVVKPLTGPVAGAPGVAGGAILGDGGVGLILDPDAVVDLAFDKGLRRAESAA